MTFILKHLCFHLVRAKAADMLLVQFFFDIVGHTSHCHADVQ